MTYAGNLRWKVIPFLMGRPKGEEGYEVRNIVINNDDIVNLKIALVQLEENGLWDVFLKKV